MEGAGGGLARQAAAGTFHAIALAQLRQRWSDEGKTPPSLLDRKAPILAPLVTQLSRRAAGAGAPAQPADVATEIEWAKARQDHPRTTSSRRRGPPPALRPDRDCLRCTAATRSPSTTASSTTSTTSSSRRLGSSTAHDFADAQHWRFRHLFVDEFQDVNPLQFRLLEAWRGERYDLFVVGDPQQAIYGWNGADPSFLLDIAATTRRSRSSVSTPTTAPPHRSWPARRPCWRPRGWPTRSRCRPASDGAAPTLTAHVDEREEARFIAKALRRGVGNGVVVVVAGRPGADPRPAQRDP